MLLDLERVERIGEFWGHPAGARSPHQHVLGSRRDGRDASRRPRWYLSVIDDDGIEQPHGGYRTRREALAAYQALTRDGYIVPRKETLAAYLETWLETRQAADISPGTRSIERTIVEAYVIPAHRPCAVPRARDGAPNAALRDARRHRRTRWPTAQG